MCKIERKVDSLLLPELWEKCKQSCFSEVMESSLHTSNIRQIPKRAVFFFLIFCFPLSHFLHLISLLKAFHQASRIFPPHPCFCPSITPSFAQSSNSYPPFLQVKCWLISLILIFWMLISVFFSSFHFNSEVLTIFFFNVERHICK